MSVEVSSSIVRVPKAGELVAAQLRRQIVTGELQANDPLPSETVLMERYGVSRPTMREAFRILESESILTVLRGAHGGARVVAPDGSVAAQHTGLLLQYRGVPLVDVYRARNEIEVSAVRVLASSPRASLEALDDLVAQAGELLDNPRAFARTDTDIHRAIVELSGNQTLTILCGMLLHVLGAHNSHFMSVHGEDHERPADEMALKAYKRLLKLIRAGDASKAADFWRMHLEKVEKYMIGESNTTLVELLS